MLLLLESHCLYGSADFDEIVKKIVASYFKDYPDHQHTFQPTFLLNDICRFWKTLLLNYENKRLGRVPEDQEPDKSLHDQLKTRQKVKNFKLKFSRMTTCFATIAAIGSHPTPVNESQIIEITRLTPRERLESIPARVPTTESTVSALIARYNRFLELTGLPVDQLESHFNDKTKRTQMFEQANAYGDAMFELITEIDQAAPHSRLLRTLVI